ncbi:hypothetical protein SERLA73DRAFT_78702 [Serpula lacrymans var. lacrymans S7.3]|uniref:Uncharacterized protein n=2 Tax=Serpula lacrymans var. lacrymans TaxID=341189 RepID=F8QE20_SERL3|nr:uncharacterized protein SERLADRAFT_443747 [Serpula lacrymans var. lacrymans S7.9]EGN93395.1 hypothetical protein SERLA73DRAFT_78702 [Serpula lacrymans var. lacrymans S7.3]EGO18774.1 hypothetical protein SERLADRAFT_443747 [Serpula lacrymans var. lacrymans S7.9]
MSPRTRRALKNMVSTVPQALDPIPKSARTLSSQPGLLFYLDKIDAAFLSSIPCPPPLRPSTPPPTGERPACQPTTPDPNFSALALLSNTTTLLPSFSPPSDPPSSHSSPHIPTSAAPHSFYTKDSLLNAAAL